MYFDLIHNSEMYGQIVAYYRAKQGIRPGWTASVGFVGSEQLDLRGATELYGSAPPRVSPA
jgi:hypothetical protein